MVFLSTQHTSAGLVWGPFQMKAFWATELSWHFEGWDPAGPCHYRPSMPCHTILYHTIAVTTVINMLRSDRRRREFVYQIKPPSHNI